MNRNTTKLERIVREVRDNVRASGVTDDSITFQFSQTLRNGEEFYKSDITIPKTIRFITDRS